MDWDKEYFYHYTSFESAVKIISSRTILFSEIKKLNDINESCGPTVLYSGLSKQEEEENDKLLSKYIQVSLTKDTPKRKGFDIPAMWGHYATKGHGACLVLDINKLISSIDERYLYHREVVYSPIENPNDFLYDKNSCIPFVEFIQESKDELFFHKTPDWSYEQEYRLIAISDEIRSIDIVNSLVAVILYNRKQEAFINSVEYNSLSKIGQDLEFYRYTPGIMSSCNLYDVKGHSLKPKLHYDLLKTKGISLEE